MISPEFASMTIAAPARGTGNSAFFGSSVGLGAPDGLVEDFGDADGLSDVFGDAEGFAEDFGDAVGFSDVLGVTVTFGDAVGLAEGAAPTVADIAVTADNKIDARRCFFIINRYLSAPVSSVFHAAGRGKLYF